MCSTCFRVYAQINYTTYFTYNVFNFKFVNLMRYYDIHNHNLLMKKNVTKYARTTVHITHILFISFQTIKLSLTIGSLGDNNKNPNMNIKRIHKTTITGYKKKTYTHTKQIKQHV